MGTDVSLSVLVERWEDRREIQNLMGRYTYALLLEETAQCFDRFWSRRDDVCYGLNTGWYIGSDSIRRHYMDYYNWVQLRSNAIRECFPEKTAGLSEDQIYGLGSLNEHPLCNQVIEIAEDRKTAKAFWYANGIHIDANEHGPISYWLFGMYACDFIMEDGEWKLWHLQYLEDIRCPCGSSWAESFTDSREENAAFSILKSFIWAPPDVPVTLREYYTKNRAFAKSPRIPEPYDTFENTFSYGRE